MPRRWKTAGELLGPRLGQVHAIPAEASVLEALEQLDRNDVGVLVVLEGGKPAGIFSERDLARKVELRGRAARDTRVLEVMTPEVLYVTPDTTLDRCALLMRADRIRHLVVATEGRLAGVLSARDILEEVVAEDARRIRNLEADRLVMTVNTGAY